jgi:hypothetical protein
MADSCSAKPCEAFRDSPATKNNGVFRDIAHARTGETSYIQHPPLRRGNCDSYPHIRTHQNMWITSWPASRTGHLTGVSYWCPVRLLLFSEHAYTQNCAIFRRLNCANPLHSIRPISCTAYLAVCKER